MKSVNVDQGTIWRQLLMANALTKQGHKIYHSTVSSFILFVIRLLHCYFLFLMPMYWKIMKINYNFWNKEKLPSSDIEVKKKFVKCFFFLSNGINKKLERFMTIKFVYAYIMWQMFRKFPESIPNYTSNFQCRTLLILLILLCARCIIVLKIVNGTKIVWHF